MAFEANLGQADERVDFLARGGGYALLLTPTEAEFLLAGPSVAPPAGSSPGSGALRMRLVGANPRSRAAGLDPLPGRVHYFRGDDPAAWRTGVPTYAKVTYKDIYPGVDLIYYGDQRRLEYDFVVASGADPGVIALDFEGAGALRLDARGDLVVPTSSGAPVRLKKPVVYQEVGGVKRSVSSGYRLEDERRARIDVGAYDTARPVVIDPVLDYSTPLGGRDGDAAYGIAVDAAGNAYVTGDTVSTDFPRVQPLQGASRGSTDVFVAKLSADGSRLLYSTYIGGSSADTGFAIALDAAGDIYVTGDTRSTDFPRATPVQATLGGAVDVFVVKLSADGSRLVYSTYLGGESGERGQGLAVDASGSAYVTGYTHSTRFPTASPLQAEFAGGNADAFVAKLSPGGSALVYSTYLGGGNDRPDYGTAIAVDAGGNAYVTGFTNSPAFPTAKPLQPFRGPTDVFVAKLNPSGAALVYSTHLGGGADDEGMGIAVDGSGSAYVTGHTESPDFPTTPGAFRTSCAAINANIPIGDICSGGDAFVSKISPDGSALVYSTYLNGRGFEVGRGISVDSAGNAYVTGLTDSPDFPTASPLQKAFGGGPFDAFVVKLNPGGSALDYSTYLGGSSEDGGYAIAADSAGNVFVTGFTSSTDFPTRKPLRGASGSARDVFVAKLVEKTASR